MAYILLIRGLLDSVCLVGGPMLVAIQLAKRVSGRSVVGNALGKYLIVMFGAMITAALTIIAIAAVTAGSKVMTISYWTNEEKVGVLGLIIPCLLFGGIAMVPAVGILLRSKTRQRTDGRRSPFRK